MRISDWSSDVCSSDLADVEATVLAAGIDGQRDAGLGHHSDPASARRDVVSQVLACAGTDQHRVATVAQSDVDGAHPGTPASCALTTAASLWARPFLGCSPPRWNGPTSDRESAL